MTRTEATSGVGDVTRVQSKQQTMFMQQHTHVFRKLHVLNTLAMLVQSFVETGYDGYTGNIANMQATMCRARA